MTEETYTPESLRDVIVNALDDGKAHDIQVLDVRDLTSITDYMVVATGRSSRQVKALAERVQDAVRDMNVKAMGVEGQQMAEWILLDFGDVVVHTMQPDIRSFYQLEKLWELPKRSSPAETVTA